MWKQFGNNWVIIQAWLHIQGLASYQLSKPTDWEALQSWLSKQNSIETLTFPG